MLEGCKWSCYSFLRCSPLEVKGKASTKFVLTTRETRGRHSVSLEALAVTETRRIFLVGWNNGIDFALYCDSDPTWTVQRWLEVIPAAMNAQATEDEEKTDVLTPGRDCLLFDWRIQEVPPDIRVNQVPKPGIIFAIRKGSKLERVAAASNSASQRDSTASEPTENGEATAAENGEATAAENGEATAAENGGEYALTYALKRELWRGESKNAKRLQAFLSAPEAAYEPLPITRYDAFISYSGEDIALAKEIASDLEAKSLRTFLASRDLAAGTVWTEEVRDALLATRVVLIVLTPNSANRPWVMCEVGASWALGKPLVPALLYVDPKTLPEVITAYQCRRIETVQGRKELVRELMQLCLGRTDAE